MNCFCFFFFNWLFLANLEAEILANHLLRVERCVPLEHRLADCCQELLEPLEDAPPTLHLVGVAAKTTIFCSLLREFSFRNCLNCVSVCVCCLESVCCYLGFMLPGEHACIGVMCLHLLRACSLKLTQLSALNDALISEKQ